MLLTKFIFLVHRGEDGYLHSVVTRLADGAQKYFYQCSGTVEGLSYFFETMTDDLVEGYFPKPNKKGRSDVDCWAFLGSNPDRAVAEELARVQLTEYKLTNKI
jgi:hypothetical protein